MVETSSHRMRDLAARSHAARLTHKRAQAAAGIRLYDGGPNDREWVALAKQKGVRLPGPDVVATPAGLERRLHALGIPVAAFLAWAGERSLDEYIQRDPSWGLRACIGLALEHEDIIRRRHRELVEVDGPDGRQLVPADDMAEPA
ncbi:MAG: hypothetical protein ACM3US_07390 [Sphingomonadaceae bacterium]